MELSGGNPILKADAFGQGFNFRIRKYTTYRTAYGFLLTLMMIMALVPFAIYKYLIMMNYGDSNILEVHDS